MADKQKLEQKLGEVLGLEMAAQKAVVELMQKPFWRRCINRHNRR
jgi:hypothetical protein